MVDIFVDSESVVDSEGFAHIEFPDPFVAGDNIVISEGAINVDKNSLVSDLYSEGYLSSFENVRIYPFEHDGKHELVFDSIENRGDGVTIRNTRDLQNFEQVFSAVPYYGDDETTDINLDSEGDHYIVSAKKYTAGNNIEIVNDPISDEFVVSAIIPPSKEYVAGNNIHITSEGVINAPSFTA